VEDLSASPSEIREEKKKLEIEGIAKSEGYYKDENF
jgi:hypothetical protein